MTSLEMENFTFSSQLERLFSIWNNAKHHINFWVHTAGIYRALAILGRVHTVFFNYHHFCEMTNMAGEIVLARILTALDLELERVLYYHDEGYDSNDESGLPGLFMRPVHVYLVSTIEASFNPTDYKEA